MSNLPDLRFESAPSLPGNEAVSKYGLAAIRALVSRLWNVTVEGVENVPLDGPALITPNHLSFCDSVFVPAALPRRMWAIGKGEYMDDWKTKHLFPAFGMIPVDRSGGSAAMDALDTAARVLDGGHLFLIYPEGTRSRSGNLHKGRTGAARLAVRCGAPIIPVGHQGTLEVQPPGQFTMNTRKDVTVRFGEPMWAEDFGDPQDPRTKRRFTDAVMFEIADLSGQTYVNTYAGDKRASADEAATRPTAPSQEVTEKPTPPRGRVMAMAASASSTQTTQSAHSAQPAHSAQSNGSHANGSHGATSDDTIDLTASEGPQDEDGGHGADTPSASPTVPTRPTRPTRPPGR